MDLSRGISIIHEENFSVAKQEVSSQLSTCLISDIPLKKDGSPFQILMRVSLSLPEPLQCAVRYSVRLL